MFDGKTFYVVDMMNDGVWVIDGVSMMVIGCIDIGVGVYGIYFSWDGLVFYVVNRGCLMGDEGWWSCFGDGFVLVVDWKINIVKVIWLIEGGGLFDMGGVFVDGIKLWFLGCYDVEVYVFDIVIGGMFVCIKVFNALYGLVVWL